MSSDTGGDTGGDTNGGWADVAAFDEIWDGAGVSVTVGDRELAVFRVAGEVFATDAMCTHGAARLCEGFIEGHEVECPLHQARFDLRTGVPSCGPATRPVTVYPARVVDGRVEVGV